MKRKIYTKPITKFIQVELEGSFASSADVQNPDDTTGRIDAQDVSADFGDFDDSFGSSEWTTTTTN